jgi:hypothetical protein
MMTTDYSIIANGFTPTTTTANIPSRVMTPIVTSPQQVFVIPRSTTPDALGVMPRFSMPTVDNFASLTGGNPISNQFALAPMAPTSATTLADGIPLYTDSTVLNTLNTGGLPLANTSSLFASSIQPQGTNLSTLGGLDGNITAVPSLASPRSLGAIPTENPDNASTVDVAKLITSDMAAKQDDVKTPSSSGSDSKAELLAMIKEVKEEVKQELKASKAGKDNGKTAESTTTPEDKTLVSASPKLSATEEAIG